MVILRCDDMILIKFITLCLVQVNNSHQTKKITIIIVIIIISITDSLVPYNLLIIMIPMFQIGPAYFLL